MNWIKRGTCTDFVQYVIGKTGMTPDDIAENYVCYKCPGISEAAKMIRGYRGPITVIADYDADGIGSGAIMTEILTRLGKGDVKVVIPRRMSDGYGLNMRMVDEDVKPGALLITVDNGISAGTAVRKAKAKGCRVIIMDHHKCAGTAPDADIIIDPHYNSTGWTFDDYCGAGLSFKLAEELFPKDKDFLDRLSCFAAISTVADLVSLRADNRNIVARGLKNINDAERTASCPESIKAMCRILGENDRVEHFDVHEISFKIAPMINSTGRLMDAGGTVTLDALTSPEESADGKAFELYMTNKGRIALVEKILTEHIPEGINTAFLYAPDIPEGICGIIAGKYAEQMNRPAFVMTDSTDGIKGSARGNGTVNIFDLLTECRDLLTKYGGHDEAAGFSLSQENVTSFRDRLESLTPEPEEKNMGYDFDLMPNEIYALSKDQQKIGIFGEGMERPVFRMRAALTSVRAIGQDGTHLSCRVNGVRAIGFGMYQKYREIGSPEKATIYGTLEENWFRGQMNIQIMIRDMETA